ncbi:MAG: cobalamin transporter ATP-binding protein [Massilia sp.]|nr:cobalamin transporter ATP-binding protein [Massilia sp.]
MISTHALGLKVGARTLVEKLDWTVRAGECWCVIGRNGAGKSTLLRTLAGLREPDAGSLSIDGRPLADWPLDELARKRAYLPQSRSDAFSYRVLETVLAARHPYHAQRYWEGSDDHAIALAALVSMEVAELAQRDVRSLSGGERQRVAIAAMLAQDTPLLLLDEPANALDLAHQVSMMQLVAKLCREQGKTAVTIGHDLNLAQQACSHALLLMGDGSWEAGPIGQVMTAPALSRYLGHPIEIVVHAGRRIFVPAQPGA